MTETNHATALGYATHTEHPFPIPQTRRQRPWRNPTHCASCTQDAQHCPHLGRERERERDEDADRDPDPDRAEAEADRDAPLPLKARDGAASLMRQ